MQPEPSTVNPKVSTTNETESNTDTRKHGISAHEPVDQLPADHNAGAGTTTDAADQLALDEAFARSLQQEAGKPHSAVRLSPPSTPSPPAVVNRITEYEQASTPPVKRREGPALEVIKKQFSPGDKHSPIQDLPNGGSIQSCSGSPTTLTDSRGLDTRTCASLAH